ncbi:MAG: hypothetical protein AMJ62_09470 [Myxococcales bacterium SG8_38]|nr:MAG: hypothetical protein AMJ62_09470 [Myxococcales bacterium SG8_38]
MTPLTELDARIAQTRHGRLTLDPRRSIATPLTEVVSRLADGRQSTHLTAAASAVAEAQMRNFPDNLFWDFDFYLASIHERASEAADYAAHLSHVVGLTVRLMQLYGQQSPIRFRYVHDFMYGFDWARWVRRKPEARTGFAPFGIEFLRQTEARGRDLLSLIEADDEWYPRLEEGVSRNPFPFPREPEDELRLYRKLAARGYVPVEAWRVDARPDAKRDFDALREETAASLGLGG